MGGGLAKEIRTWFPWCYFAYKNFCEDKPPYDLLGKVCWTEERCRTTGEGFIFANIFGQLNYGRTPGTKYTSYAALEGGLQEVHKYAKATAYSVSMPHGIGCGLGGGDWKVVSDMIERIFDDEVVCEIWRL